MSSPSLSQTHSPIGEPLSLLALENVTNYWVREKIVGSLDISNQETNGLALKWITLEIPPKTLSVALASPEEMDGKRGHWKCASVRAHQYVWTGKIRGPS